MEAFHRFGEANAKRLQCNLIMEHVREPENRLLLGCDCQCQEELTESDNAVGVICSFSHVRKTDSCLS